VFEFGSGAKFLSPINPWYDRSALIQSHNLWLVIYLIFCIAESSEITITAGNGAMLFLTALIQLAFFACNFAAEMRRWQAFHYFNLNSGTALPNMANLGLLCSLWFEFMARCANNGCFAETARAHSSAATFFATVAKFFIVCNFAVGQSSVFVLVRAIIKVMLLYSYYI